jgi:pyruvate ferredoxin oxidoreductase delta subunit
VAEAGRRGVVVRTDEAGHILPLSYGAPGSMGKTGTWRTERPVVRFEKCVGCYLCWLYCPEHVIEMVPREKAGVKSRAAEVPIIDYDYCKGCGICANVCPVKAIDMVSEEEFLREQAKAMRRG